MSGLSQAFMHVYLQFSYFSIASVVQSCALVYLKITSLWCDPLSWLIYATWYCLQDNDEFIFYFCRKNNSSLLQLLDFSTGTRLTQTQRKHRLMVIISFWHNPNTTLTSIMVGFDTKIKSRPTRTNSTGASRLARSTFIGHNKTTTSTTKVV